MKIKILFLATIISLNASAQISTNGLVASYPFTGNANDASGNAQNGTVMGATLTSDRFGNANAAYSFNGSSNYIQIPATNLVNNEYSYSVWAQISVLPSVGSQYMIFDVGSSTGDQYINVPNQVAQYNGFGAGGYYTSSSTHYTVYPGVTPVANQWKHIVVTRSFNMMRLYIDGVLMAFDSTANTTLPYYGSGSANARVGIRFDNTLAFKGKIDDIYLYNRVLNTAEINELYTNCGININQQPSSSSIFADNNTSFSVTAINSTNSQWQIKNGSSFSSLSNDSIYSGVSLTTLNLTNVPLSFDGNIYRCILGNGTCIDSTVEVVLNVSSTSADCNPLITLGLVSYYPFCGNANDESGNNQHGNVIGATLTTDRFGNANSAYNFNGTGSTFINIPADSMLNNIYSYSAWALVDVLPNIGNQYMILDIGSSTGDQYLNVPNQVAQYNGFGAGGYYTSSATHYTVYPGTNPIANQWQHIVVTRSTNMMKLYLNGVLVAFDSTASNTLPYYGSSSPIAKVGIRFDSTLPFSGKIDDIGIYNRVLSDSEVVQLYDICTSVNFSVNISAQGNTTICEGNNLVLNADSGLSYNWNNGASTQNINVTQSGNYSVVATNNNGCKDTSNIISVNINPLPIVSIIAQGNTIFCEGDSVELNSGNASVYLWSNGNSSQNLFVYQSGNYYAIVTDSLGCSDTTNIISVTAYTNPVINLGNDINTCSGGSNILDAGIINGGSYTWSTAETTQTITVSLSGDYSVTVLDINGCVGYDSISVNYNALPEISGTVNRSDSGNINIGIVNLYNANDTTLGGYIAVQTASIINGSYNFTNLQEGEYKLLFVPDSSLYYPNVLNQYYSNTTIWDSASIVSVLCGQTYTANVTITVLNTLNGSGVIGGSIVDMGTGKANALGDPIAGINVYLQQTSLNDIIAGTQTDAQGLYRFNNVPAGTFRILVNIPGLGMVDSYTVTLAANDSSVENNYVVSDTSIAPVNSITSAKHIVEKSNLVVYPNPNNGTFMLNVNSEKGEITNVEIINATGQILQNGKHQLKAGSNQIPFNVTAKGMYFIRILRPNEIQNIKIIVE